MNILQEETYTERQIKYLLQDSIQTGIDTHNNLLIQSEQLNRNKVTLNKMDEQLTQSENIVDGLECIWYKFVNLFRDTESDIGLTGSNRKGIDLGLKENNEEVGNIGTVGQNDVNQMISDLKNISLNIGKEVDQSIKTIKGMGAKTENLEQREGHLIQRQKRIMKS